MTLSILVQTCRFFFFLLLILLSCTLQGQDTYNKGKVVFIAKGKMLNFQDETGFLWGFDEEGYLSRFDGYEFQKITGNSQKSYRNCSQSFYNQGIDFSSTIIEDREHKLWIISELCSLLKYDPNDNTIEDYRDSLAKISGIEHPILFTSFKDKDGGLWWGSQTGIFHLSALAQTFEFFKLDALSEVKVMSIFEDRQGYLWCRHERGFSKFDRKEKKFLELASISKRESDDLTSLPSNVWGSISTLQLGEQGRFLFLGLRKSLYFDVAQKRLDSLSVSLAPGEAFTAGFQKGKECILGTSRGSLWKMSENGHFVRLFVPGLEDINHSIFSLFEDKQGVVWMGGMINYNNVEIFKLIPGSEIEFFPYPNTSYANLFTYDGIALGLSSEGLFSIREGEDLAARFNRGYTAPFDFSSYHQPVIDEEGDIWVGTNRKNKGEYYFLYEFGSDGKLKSSYTRFGSDSLSFFSGEISDVKLGREGILWISSNGLGLVSLDPGPETFEYYPKAQKGQFFFLGCDTKGTVWMNYQSDGVSRYFPSSDTMIHFQFSPNDTCSISDNTFGKIFEDSQGTIWVGSFNGLNRWDSLNDCFHTYYKEDGLSWDRTHSILEDQNGDIWVSSHKGVSKYRPEYDDFVNVNILAEQIGAHAVVDRNGYIFFEGYKERDGVFFFHPDSIKVITDFPRLVLLDFLSASKESSDLTSIGSRLNVNAPLKLTYDQDIFTVHFSALEYHSPEKIQFAYRLDGFDEDWRRVGSSREATYTNLDPGDYTFRLISTNSQGIWSEDGPRLKITIFPPWWATWWAYSLYILAFLASSYFLYRFQLNRQLTRTETERLRELDEVKTRLYTNITHEFRTPLTIIQGMNEKIRQTPQKWVERGTEMIQRNSDHLLRLVNQMLDLSKLESGRFSLNLIQADVIPYLHYLVDSFHSFAETKEINLHILPKVESLIMDYDPERLTDLLSNLLSNAIKFTPEGGNVYVSLYESESSLVIEVRDTGIGISEEKLPHIFDRFYQADDSHTRQGEGTGIGLALTRELVKLMDGDISATSTEGKGTTFTITLPVTRQAMLSEHLFTEEKTAKTYVPTEVHTETIVPVVGVADAEIPLALIVEDHADVVNYLTACLEADYRLEIARNGQKGIDKALAIVPDIIISDVMMPEKDGFEVCNTLKQDMRTSHIPIILLTAKADVESRISGLKRGADAYLAKPFHEEELLVRMGQLLELRDKLQQKYSSADYLTETKSATPKTEPSLEDRFITQVRAVIETHLNDYELDVSMLCRELGMSRAPLHNKLKALTGKSTTEFIRFIRLSKARELLMTTDLNISEIGYDTGFQNPNYFTKRFGEVFGMSPSEYREQYVSKK